MTKSNLSKIFVAVPMHKYEISAATTSSLLSAGTTVKHDIQFCVHGISLLARNFNYMFSMAYNDGFDYIFYIHSDIGVHSRNGLSWVDNIILRMQQSGAAVISTVVPIKNDLGVTSTAIQLSKISPYPLKRLTVKQLGSIKQTPLIDRETVCRVMDLNPSDVGALLVNTGVMCMNLKEFDWTKWSGFNIFDKIVWNTKKKAKGFTIPEDWHLSIWLHSMGWPYYVSKELKVIHGGYNEYFNYGNWGEGEDLTVVSETMEEWEKS